MKSKEETRSKYLNERVSERGLARQGFRGSLLSQPPIHQSYSCQPLPSSLDEHSSASAFTVFVPGDLGLLYPTSSDDRLLGRLRGVTNLPLICILMGSHL